jgi:hypothetical protein
VLWVLLRVLVGSPPPQLAILGAPAADLGYDVIDARPGAAVLSITKFAAAKKQAAATAAATRSARANLETIKEETLRSSGAAA